MASRSNHSEAARAGLNGSGGNDLCDTNAEWHVTACLILDPFRAIPLVAQIINEKDFTDLRVGKAFTLIAAMHAAGGPIDDHRAVVSHLLSAGCDVVKELVREATEIPNVATVVWHAERIRNLSRLREIYAAADEIKHDALAPNAKADDLVGAMEARLLRLRHGSARDARPFDVIAAEVIADLEARVKCPEPAVLLSGLPSADNVGFVFGAGELCILAARPGVGKTSLATQIAMHHSGRGKTVLFASLEMRDRDLISRVLISSAGHNHQLIRTSRIDAECVNDIRRANEEIGNPTLFVWSPGRVKAGMIHAAAAMLKSTANLRLLVVDYLGYVRADDPRKERYEQVGDSVKALRDIGQALGIPVLCLCQLNREADDSVPRLKNLRESGDIEQDADVVAFLHPADPKDRTRVDLIVAKDRQGASGSVSLKWHAAQTQFSDLSARDHSNFDPAFDEWNNQ